MHALDAFCIALGLLLAVIGIRAMREAKVIRREVAERWRREAGTHE